jgi:hypothetical protein
MSKEWTKKGYLKKIKLGTYCKKEKRQTKKKMEGVLRAMEECGLQDGDWEDRLRWRLSVERRWHTS